MIVGRDGQKLGAEGCDFGRRKSRGEEAVETAGLAGIVVVRGGMLGFG